MNREPSEKGLKIIKDTLSPELQAAYLGFTRATLAKEDQLKAIENVGFALAEQALLKKIYILIAQTGSVLVDEYMKEQGTANA
jgi:hypothetical protein